MVPWSRIWTCRGAVPDVAADGAIFFGEIHCRDLESDKKFLE